MSALARAVARDGSQVLLTPRPCETLRARFQLSRAFVKLQEDARGNPWPGPLFKLWRANHPPLGERIEFSNDYHPWREGASLRYGTLFRN
jgi:hypothetical protein